MATRRATYSLNGIVIEHLSVVSFCDTTVGGRVIKTQWILQGMRKLELYGSYNKECWSLHTHAHPLLPSAGVNHCQALSWVWGPRGAGLGWSGPLGEKSPGGAGADGPRRALPRAAAGGRARARQREARALSLRAARRRAPRRENLSAPSRSLSL